MSTQPQMIAGMGFARMAWELAWRRRGYRHCPRRPAPWPVEISREYAAMLGPYSVPAEYFRIIDAAIASLPLTERGGGK